MSPAVRLRADGRDTGGRAPLPDRRGRVRIRSRARSDLLRGSATAEGARSSGVTGWARPRMEDRRRRRRLWSAARLCQDLGSRVSSSTYGVVRRSLPLSHDACARRTRRKPNYSGKTHAKWIPTAVMRGAIHASDRDPSRVFITRPRHNRRGASAGAAGEPGLCGQVDRARPPTAVKCRARTGGIRQLSPGRGPNGEAMKARGVAMPTNGATKGASRKRYSESGRWRQMAAETGCTTNLFRHRRRGASSRPNGSVPRRRQAVRTARGPQQGDGDTRVATRSTRTPIDPIRRAMRGNRLARAAPPRPCDESSPGRTRGARGETARRHAPRVARSAEG